MMVNWSWLIEQNSTKLLYVTLVSLKSIMLMHQVLLAWCKLDKYMLSGRDCNGNVIMKLIYLVMRYGYVCIMQCGSFVAMRCWVSSYL